DPDARPRAARAQSPPPPGQPSAPPGPPRPPAPPPPPPAPPRAKADRRTDDEAADVRPERGAAAEVARGANRAHAVQQLHHKPDPEKEDRGDLDDVDEDQEEDHRQHARLRVEDEVRAHHARDRAAGPH